MPLPANCILISDSDNGKKRAIERRRTLIAEDLKVIQIFTIRRFFEPDVTDVDGLGMELTGKIDYPAYEHTLTASNDQLCNPVNGISCYPSGTTSGTTYVDAVGNVVASPIGLYDFFAPFLDQPVAIHTLVNQNITLEDSVYHTWNK